MKISFRKSYWLPNTVIHSYLNAIHICGPANIELIFQDHSQFWYIYYEEKNCYLTSKRDPVYYRVLSPFTVTSSKSKNKENIDWTAHNIYLDGYGPWISINGNVFFLKKIYEISDKYFKDRVNKTYFYWILNKLKYFHACILNK